MIIPNKETIKQASQNLNFTNKYHYILSNKKPLNFIFKQDTK